MSWLSRKWTNFKARVLESLTWLSVQVTAGWGVIWMVYGSLPADTMVEIAQIHYLGLSVPAWMGIAQTLTTYLARVKKQAAP